MRLSFAATAFFLTLPFAAPVRAQDVAIRAGLAIDGHGNAMPNAVIVVRGNRIVSVQSAPPTGARMTLDDVVAKTGILLLTAVVTAGAAWVLDVGMGIALVAALVGFGLAMVNIFKKKVSPPLVIAYAVVEGVFVGAFSKVITIYVGGDVSIVYQAILGTVGAFAGTLAVYKFFNIKVTDKFRKVVTIAIFSFVGVMLVNFVLSLTGVLESGGLRGFNTLGLLVSAAAVVLAVLMLILDFDYVERGVAAGIPERESWRAAFGLTVTLVWLYIELLRILAILRGGD